MTKLLSPGSFTFAPGIDPSRERTQWSVVHATLSYGTYGTRYTAELVSILTREDTSDSKARQRNCSRA